MNSASMELVARVAVRNEIETAKALRAGRAVALSAGAREALAGKPASTGQEVAR